MAPALSCTCIALLGLSIVNAKTAILIGQNYESEFNDYITSVGQPAGASFYTTFKNPSAFQGDGLPFVDHVNSAYPGSFAELGLSLKESYTESQCNIVYDYLGAIAQGEYDAQIDELSAVISKYSNLTWLIRVGYEVSEFIFSYKLPSGCANGYGPADIDNSHYHDAFNRIVSKMKVNGRQRAVCVSPRSQSLRSMHRDCIQAPTGLKIATDGLVNALRAYLP